MGMIPQNMGERQEALSSVLCGLPIVLAADAGTLYYLVRDIDQELEDFIATGRTETIDFQTIPGADMQSMADHWSRLGLDVAYLTHQMEYMGEKVTITYPQISNAATNMKISLIPWFLLNGRPYPVFAYAYASWHYRTTGGASQQKTAEATGRVFGIESFHKSTVCRTIGLMEGIFDLSFADGPQGPETRGVPSPQEVAELVPRILEGHASIEALEEMCGGKAKRMPERAETPRPRTFDDIPCEYSNVMKETPPARAARRDGRKRPARPSRGAPKRKRPRQESADPAHIEKIRRDFIAIIREASIGAAIVYHRLLSQIGTLPATTPADSM